MFIYMSNYKFVRKIKVVLHNNLFKINPGSFHRLYTQNIGANLHVAYLRLKHKVNLGPTDMDPSKYTQSVEILK